jgi:hypothetical protein
VVSLSRFIYYDHPATSLKQLKKPAQKVLENMPVFTIDDTKIKVKLSDVARMQLLLRAAAGLEKTETQLLSKFDDLMRGNGPSREEAAIVGVCLRRLGLLYRKRVKRYKFHTNGMPGANSLSQINKR